MEDADFYDDFNDDVGDSLTNCASVERNSNQMIEILFSRLKLISDDVQAKKLKCSKDLDAWSSADLVSTKNMPAQPNSTRDSHVTISSDADLIHDDTFVINPHNLVFKKQRMTENGKRLQSRIEDDAGFSSNMPIGRSSSHGKQGDSWESQALQTGKRRSQTFKTVKRIDRVRLEQLFQSNMEKFLTRSVLDETYNFHRPISFGDQLCESISVCRSEEEEELFRNESVDLDISRKRIISLDDDNSSVSSAKSGRSVSTDNSDLSSKFDVSSPVDVPVEVHNLLDACFIRWPIPISSAEMYPRLFLLYSCERAELQGVEKSLKKTLCKASSQRLFLFLFWYCKCLFFQQNSREEQSFLLSRLSTEYVNTLRYTTGLTKQTIRAIQDSLFRLFSYVMANSVYWGFYYLFPGSRHLYGSKFRNLLFLQVVRLLSGMDMCTTTVEQHMKLVFPDDCIEGCQFDAMEGPAIDLNEIGQKKQIIVIDPISRSSSLEEDFRGQAAFSNDQPKDNGDVWHNLRSNLRLPPLSTNCLETNDNKSRVRRCARKIDRLPTACTMPTLLNYVGSGDSLKLYKSGDKGAKRKKMGRQPREPMHSGGISPLVQQFMKQHSPTGGKRQEVLRRTAPVPWCVVGGSNTFIKSKSRQVLHSALRQEAENLLLQEQMQKSLSRKEMRQSMKELSKTHLEAISGRSTKGGNFNLETAQKQRLQSNLQPYTSHDA